MTENTTPYEQCKEMYRVTSRDTWPPKWLDPAVEPEPELTPEPATEPVPLIAEPEPIEPLTGWSAWIEHRDGRTWRITQRDDERVTAWESGIPWTE